MVVVLLSAAELNVFISEVDERVLRKAGVRWVLSTIGGEPLAMELTEKGVCTVSFSFYFCLIVFEHHDAALAVN